MVAALARIKYRTQDQLASTNSHTNNHARHTARRPQRVVIKLGTQLLTGGRDSLDESTVAKLVAQVAEVRKGGVEVLVVTSGAVAAGRNALAGSKSAKRVQPRTVAYRQALAALGQTQLMLTYERLFGEQGIEVAQALISRDDLQSRLGYLNIRNTLETLLEIGAVPVINENDVVAVEELEGEVYGDNDRLSAMVANAVDADLLILLGDMEGLFTADPHIDPEALVIPLVEEITPQIEAIAGETHDGRGRGGMASKLAAARLATSSGTEVVIASGRTKNVIRLLCEGQELGTRFKTRVSRVESRKRWMLTGLSEHRGGVSVDSGAVRALKEQGHSLLPAGIVAVDGVFNRGDIIAIRSPRGEVVAWGLANYASLDVETIKGRNSREVPALLGHDYGHEVVHRNNMTLA